METIEKTAVYLSDLQPTECFYFCGSNWIVMEHTEKTTKSREMNCGFRKLELNKSSLVDQV